MANTPADAHKVVLTIRLAVPPPGYHDLMAMLKFGTLRIEGNLHPFMSHLLYFKDLLALLRPAAVPA